MKRIYTLSLSLALLITSAFSFGQQTTKGKTTKTDTTKTKTSTTSGSKTSKTTSSKEKTTNEQNTKAGFGVSVVQTEAEFLGGQQALAAFIHKNMIYPKEAQRSGAEGRVYIGVKITSEGKIQDARVLTSVNEELDAEALRIVNMMPDWIPGTVGGNPVDVQYIIPFNFVLPKKL